jgi:hypothetical protein
VRENNKKTKGALKMKKQKIKIENRKLNSKEKTRHLLKNA